MTNVTNVQRAIRSLRHQCATKRSDGMRGRRVIAVLRARHGRWLLAATGAYGVFNDLRLARHMPFNVSGTSNIVVLAQGVEALGLAQARAVC